MDENINILILNDISRNVIRFLSRNLASIFNAGVRVSRHIIVPTRLFNEDKKQYEGRKLLKYITENLTLKEVRGINLALFDRDLFTGSLDYAFGVASPFPRICIMSLLRLHPHFDQEYFAGGMEKRSAGRFPLVARRLSSDEKDLYYGRILREAVHGIGHTLGLTHCTLKSCIMYQSATVDDIDGKQAGFCSSCLHLL